MITTVFLLLDYGYSCDSQSSTPAYSGLEPVSQFCFPRFHRNHSFPSSSSDASHPHLVVSPHVDPVVFAMVMYGQNSAIEGLLALKSALMHISRPVEFHIICSLDAVDIVQEKLSLFSRPSYDVTVLFYPMTEASINARANRARVGSIHEAGAGGLVKVFLHEVLHDVEKVIFFDTDMLFLVDPYLLWREFDRFQAQNQKVLVSFPTLGPESTSDVVCSCIMLLNLNLLRQEHFMPSTLFPSELQTLGNSQTWSIANIDPVNPDFGDQGFYFAVWKRYGSDGGFRDLSVSWDMTHCRYSYGMSLADGNDSMSELDQVTRQTYLREAKVYEQWNQLYPAVLHFNCQPSSAVVWDDPINSNRPRWGPYVVIAKQYKWIWLNRGDGSSSVKTGIVSGRQFWDEVEYGNQQS